MKGIGVGILGIAHWLPKRIRTNDFWDQDWRARHAERVETDLATAVDHAARVRPDQVDMEVATASVRYAGDLFRGARERRVIAEEDQSSDLEVRAAMRALDRAGCAIEDIDLLISYSQLPDHPTPSNHGLLAHKLGLPVTAAAWTVDAGCASFLTQLATASRWIQVGEASRALIVVSSAMSRITNYAAPSSVNTGDGAVAAVLGAVGDGFGYVAHEQRTRGSLHGGIILGTDSREPWYRGDLHRSALLAGNHDRAATHVMGAQAASMCREACHGLLDRVEMSPEEVDFFVLAQATAWFPEALCKAVGISAERALSVEEHFARYGHLLPGSVALNLSLAVESGRLQRGDAVLLYSPGAGFTQAATLMRWSGAARARRSSRM